MNTIKVKFKKWLLKKSDSKLKYEATVNNYLKKIDEICKETFPNTSDQEYAWEKLSDWILPVLAKYYERANKGYKLDRITIWDAIGYYRKIIYPMYQTGWLPNDDINEAELYFFDGKDYYINTVHVKDLYEYIKLFNGIVFEHSLPSKIILGYDLESDFTNKIIKIVKDNKIKHPEDMALHIVYKSEGKYTGKFVLEKFSEYLHTQRFVLQYNHKNNELLYNISNLNPTQTAKGNYKEIRCLTGEHSSQVAFTPKSIFSNRPDENYVLTQDDLAQIFHINEVTACDLMSRFTRERKATGKPYIRTILTDYYGIDAVNACLEDYHHYDINLKIDKVDYTKEGFDKYWYTREEALKIVGIRKQAFYNRVKSKSVYIDYAKQAPKYYIPHLKRLKNAPNLRRIRIKNKTTNNNTIKWL